ncbi:hypothetical protein KC332_g11233 [Hortaea werneckii]|nr:hypothetical protein KC350_g16224 [Hortaea werneckii]KAI6820703.1 hypothetical protein KC358_g9352 [Hortaea werneckii]KAI6916536.1 hypothetical protein KC348_g11518 [Hortaea werneckii]KAI6919090.1 hypothetical protein KC341_g17526 [Hortaea werneckii]KAI6962953.1 hypothetical protein KC321_g11483 [Hortaea werneckii]
MGKDATMSTDPPKHQMVYFPELTSKVRSFGQFRKVMHTGLYSQLVTMEIPVGGDIGDEVHTVDQVLIFTSGEGKATVAGVDQPLELVTVYSPAEHDPQTVHKTKAEGDEEEENGKDEAPEWAERSKEKNEELGEVKTSGGPYGRGDDGRHVKG